MAHLFGHIDSFTNKPFSGNPAAVVVLEKLASDEWMQSVAAEMNLSETAFVFKSGDHFNLRWFTPTVEVSLCGHATLAAAYFLWHKNIVAPDRLITFKSKSGDLTVANKNDWIELDFPQDLETEIPIPLDALEALGLNIPQALYAGKRDLMGVLIELDSSKTVRNLKPDFGKLKAIEPEAIVVTAADETGKYDFVSRFFGPKIGINEDPVTGAAHTCFTPYWAKKLQKKELLAYQASERGGELRLKYVGERVKIMGQATLIKEGHLLI